MLPHASSSDPATKRLALVLGLGTTVAFVAMRQRAIRAAIASMLSVRAFGPWGGGGEVFPSVGRVGGPRGGWGGGGGGDETRARGSRGERVGRTRARARGRVGGWTRARGRAFDRVIWCVTRGAGARTDEAFGTRET